MGLINERKVLDFYIEQIKKDNITFLRGNEYITNKIEQEILKLRDEADMHNKIQVAKELWKLLFEASMTFIDPDKRGYDTLFKYFDAYVNFEEIIFASDSFYRDHTLHCLWVYFLEEYLVRQEEFGEFFKDLYNFEGQTNEFINDLRELDMEDIFGEFIEAFGDKYRISQYGESIRCVSALTHDLGYPLKKIGKVNQCIKEVLPYFGIFNYDEFNFSYNDVQQNYIQNFLEVLNSPVQFNVFSFENEEDERVFKMAFVDKGGFLQYSVNKEVIRGMSDRDKAALKRAFKIRMFISKSSDVYLRNSNDFEQYQHGIMSAFLLMKTVRAFGKMKLNYSDSNDIQPWGVNYKDYYSKYMILNSVSCHTSEGFQIRHINSDLELLMMVDEFEEFSRISRANQNRQYINEFSSTEITKSGNWLQIDFIFDNPDIPNLDPERFFKDKCRKFLNIFDIPALNNNIRIRIRCIGKLPLDNNVYTLEIGRKYANILINQDEQNIPKYLKSAQYYTKESYMSM